MREFSLNGWWDFLPVYDPAAPVGAVPENGWLPQAYLVPSLWTIPLDGVRRRGEKWFRGVTWDDLPADPAEIERDWEFLFDTTGYPIAWSKTRRGWLRRSFEVPAVAADERVLLHFAAVMPQAAVWVNGVAAGENCDPTLPFTLDVTALVQPGGNELAVFIDDYDCVPGTRRTLVPSGNDITYRNSGIWQDVTMQVVAAVRATAVAVRCHLAARELELVWELRNDTGVERDAVLRATVGRWPGESAAALLTPPPLPVRLPARGTVEITQRIAVGAALPEWSPADPALCLLQAWLDDAPFTQRFGWREIVLCGDRLELNGRPLHLAGDWGHKWTQAHHTDAWNRAWFAMMRDANLNHIRLHAHPHPVNVLELADEMGILVTDETAVWGSGCSQGSESPLYWERAADHVRRLVRRDRNHPSLILWSVENEMRWNRDADGLTDRELPKLCRLFEALDPTRPVYHDGDSSLWDETAQPIISRHYGKECSGLGWWDHRSVLLSSEMALYHMAAPNNCCHFGGDALWADHRLVKRASGIDAARIVEDGRTVGVTAFHPWNLCGLENYRFHPEQRFTYPDDSAPGVKPRRLAAGSCEFEYWRTDGGRCYHPSELFEIQKRAFRPFALIDRSHRCGYYAGSTASFTIYAVNDRPDAVSGTLFCAVIAADGSRWEAGRAVTVLPGEVCGETFTVTLPATVGAARSEVWFVTAAGEELERCERHFLLGAAEPLPRLQRPLRIFGSGKTRPLWAQLDAPAEWIDSFDALRGDEIVVVEPNTVPADDAFRSALAAFTARGGRVLLLEQTQSVFPTLEVVDMPLQKVHIRRHHPVLSGVAAAELEFWSDAPYSDLNGDALVSRLSYRKDDGATVRFLLDGGDGFFGNGSMEQCQLLEAPLHTGWLLASQLRLAACAAAIPAARRLLVNMLQYLDTVVAPPPSGAEPPLLPLAAALAAARAGQCAWTRIDSAAEVEALAAATGCRLEPVEQTAWQLVKSAAAPDGINNEDACGIVTWTYSNPALTNTPVATRLFRPHPQLEAWLETAPLSGLAELFVGTGRTEALRAHTLGRIAREAAAPLVGAGRLAVGDGSLILWQLTPESAWPRFARLRRTVWDTLALWRPGGALDGVMRLAERGDGAPSALLYCAAAELEPAKLVAALQPSTEHLFAAGVGALARWRKLATPEGCVELPADAAPEVVLYGAVASPVPRPDFDPDLRVPNPEAMTVLELTGSGRIGIYINGQLHREVDLTPDRPVGIADIYLSYTMNTLALWWRPAAGERRLQLRFRTLFRKPETSLQFSV